MTPNVAKYFDYYGLADKHADKFERWIRKLSYRVEEIKCVRYFFY